MRWCHNLHTADGNPQQLTHALVQALRRKANESAVKMAVNHYFPSEKQVDASENSELESLGDAMGTQKKVDKWYEEMTAGEDPYRSNVLFLEVKMRELLGEAWPKRAAEPDVVRASVCCDMLARLIEIQPNTKELGLKLLDELIFSIFQSRTGVRACVRACVRAQVSASRRDTPLPFWVYHVLSQDCGGVAPSLARRQHLRLPGGAAGAMDTKNCMILVCTIGGKNADVVI